MIELEPRSQPFLQNIPNEYKFEAPATWFEGFAGTIAYNNMPLVESVQEQYLFGNVERDTSFRVQDHVKDEYLPYYKDIARAKNLEHLRYIEGMMEREVQRKKDMDSGGVTAMIAGSFIDPLFITSFVPVLNMGKLGATVGSATLRMAGFGGAYGVASELRRAPFAMTDDDYESATNIAAATVLSGMLGGGLRGASYASPFLKSTIIKGRAWAKGEPIPHFIDTKTGKISLVATKPSEVPFDTKRYNPFGSELQRLLADPEIPQEMKLEFLKLSYNSSVGLKGGADFVAPQSVMQKAHVHEGGVRRLDEQLRDLFEGHAYGRKKHSQTMGIPHREFNPMDSQFEDWLGDTLKRYILSNSPDAKVAQQARTALSTQQKEAFGLFKNLFDEFDADARSVGLLKNDEQIVSELRFLGDELAKKKQMLADIDDNVKAKGGSTKKQTITREKLEKEISGMQSRADILEEALNAPTRKSYLFPIYYNKEALQDPKKYAELKEIFVKHYQAKGLPEPLVSADRTIRRIMEENAEELEDGLYQGLGGGAKHLKFRKTDIDEWQIAEHMVLNMDAIYTYAARMGRKIEFQRAYGGKNIVQVADEIEAMGRNAGLSEAKVAKAKKAFVGEHDRVMGALIRNPSSLNNQLTQFSKTYAGWAYLGGAGISAIADGGTIVLSHGMRDVMRGAKAMLDANTRGKVFKDARQANTAIEAARAIVQQRFLGDSIKSVQPNMLERVQTTGNRYFYMGNLLAPITTAYKILDQILVNDKFIRLSKQLLNKEIDIRDKEYLFRYGIDEDLARYINDMPYEKADADDFFLANTDNWPRETVQQREMLRRYQAATAAHSDNAVIMGQGFDKPLIADGVVYIKDNPFFAGMRKKFPNMFAIDERASTAKTKYVRIENGTMTLPFTFMNFAFGANNKILGAITDPARKYRLQGVVALMGLSYLSLNIKGSYSWNKAKENWAESPDMIARLIDHSGAVGVYADLGYMGLSMAANIANTDGGNWPISPKYIDKNEQYRMLDGIAEPFGAPLGVGIDIYRGANDFINGNYTEAGENFRSAAPFLGLPLIGDDMKEMLGGKSRY